MDYYYASPPEYPEPEEEVVYCTNCGCEVDPEKAVRDGKFVYCSQECKEA
jgi:hypothetical protein